MPSILVTFKIFLEQSFSAIKYLLEQPWRTQKVITCSKLTMETLDQGVKYVQTIKALERRH